jgi:murein DD-endopeptidase MepM/ murein hydrolase activator NlpD
MRTGLWLVMVGAAACGAEERRDGLPAQQRVQQDPTRFGFPVKDRVLITARVGVDHDPINGTGLAGDATCLDYAGRTFPHCYDEHHGTDLILDGGFETMDAGSTAVLAAAGGRVVNTDDGNYDRCHIDLGEVTCDGFAIKPNFVDIEHPDGLVTRYLHLKRDSVLVVPGQWVDCGDPIGLVGSSGNSSMPHLHFEVRTPDGPWIDPFAGPFSQPVSLWEDQGSDNGMPEGGCTER